MSEPNASAPSLQRNHAGWTIQPSLRVRNLILPPLPLWSLPMSSRPYASRCQHAETLPALGAPSDGNKQRFVLGNMYNTMTDGHSVHASLDTMGGPLLMLANVLPLPVD